MPSDRFKPGQLIMFKHTDAIGRVMNYGGVVMDKPPFNDPAGKVHWWIDPGSLGCYMLIAEEDITDGR